MPEFDTHARKKTPGMVLLSPLVDRPTDERYHARNLDKRAMVEKV